MFRTFIDEAEIEEWFEEEKTALNTDLYAASYQKKDIENAKSTYDKKFSRLLIRYNKEHESLTRRTERRRRWHQPIVRLTAWWTHLRHHVSQKHLEYKESFKKWRFDREYQRLMKK